MTWTDGLSDHSSQILDVTWAVTWASHHSSQVVVEGAAILAVVIVDVDLIVDPGR
jgi:hypothetical protein